MDISPEVASLRGRVASLHRAGRIDEAKACKRDTMALLLLREARRAAAHQPPLTATQIDEIVEALRGTPAA